MLYTILEHVIWRFRIYNLFREISKSLDFDNCKKFAEDVAQFNNNFYQNRWTAAEIFYIGF